MTTYAIGIITDGKDPDMLIKTLNSITKQIEGGMPVKAILIGGNPPKLPSVPILTSYPMEEAAQEGKLGYMRNQLVIGMMNTTTADVYILLDDDMELHEDFYRGLQEYGDAFDVLTCRILNPDGTRFWDWARWKGPHGQELMDYDEQDYTNVYITGGLCIARKEVFDHVRWDKDKGFYEQEDIDFSEKVKAAGLRISHCLILNWRPVVRDGSEYHGHRLRR